MQVSPATLGEKTRGQDPVKRFLCYVEIKTKITSVFPFDGIGHLLRLL